MNYWEDRLGTHDHPIILNAADGAHTATFTGGINMFNTHHFYLIGVDINHDGDSFHCEQCSYTLIRNSSMDGNLTSATVRWRTKPSRSISPTTSTSRIPTSLEPTTTRSTSSPFSTAIFVENRVSRADDWCAYSKGGSAYPLSPRTSSTTAGLAATLPVRGPEFNSPQVPGCITKRWTSKSSTTSFTTPKVPDLVLMVDTTSCWPTTRSIESGLAATQRNSCTAHTVVTAPAKVVRRNVHLA